MIENILVIILIISAAVYVIWHFKKILTIGEGPSKCNHCPLAGNSPKNTRSHKIR